ncbi:MAG TPA: hypothetical protein VF755_23980 [Catenuloplanes sp.]|jgi:hypothetical protein
MTDTAGSTKKPNTDGDTDTTGTGVCSEPEGKAPAKPPTSEPARAK